GFLDLELISVRLPTDNTLELRHRIRPTPWLVQVTTATAAPGAVEVVGRLERDPRVAEGRAPERLPPPNLCWGFDRGADVAAGGRDPRVVPTLDRPVLHLHGPGPNLPRSSRPAQDQ